MLLCKFWIIKRIVKLFILIHITDLEHFEFFEFLVDCPRLCLFHSYIEYLSHGDISIYEHSINSLEYALIFSRIAWLMWIDWCCIIFIIFFVVWSFFIDLEVDICYLLISDWWRDASSRLFALEYDNT